MKFRQRTLRVRLAFGFGVVLALLAAVAFTSLLQLSALNRNVEALATVRLHQLITVSQANNHLEVIARSTGNALLLADEKQVKDELAAVRQNRQHIAELLARLGKTLAPGREQELFDGIQSARAAYLPHEDEFLKFAEQGEFGSAKDALLRNMRPAQLRLLDAMEHFVEYQMSASADEARKTGDTFSQTRASILALSVLAVLCGLVAAGLIIRSLRAELGGEPAYASEVANRIAGGDLSREVEVGASDTGSLLFAMREMSRNLRQLVGDVAQGAHAVADSSAQIAQGNLDLSQRTEEQASTLEETASSLEELTSTVTQNADNARQASELAAGASEVARKGGQVVGQVVSTMTGISDSSKKIADIIGVIDGIAFQTNILALNAAVEAARAGEQGRGFAVVAAEVRNLAQRSAAAAKEIKGLISDSVGRVEAGTRLVGAAGQTMNEIVKSVNKVSDLIREIAAASEEQSTGIEQVNKAVAQMEQVVQQNASLVEEASAATESMKEQAGSLLQTVARFELGGAAAASRIRVPSPVRPRPPAAPARVQHIAKLAPAHEVVLQRAQAAPGNGAWQEF